MKIIYNVESLFKLRSGIGHYVRHLLTGVLKRRADADMFYFQGTKWRYSQLSQDDIDGASLGQGKRRPALAQVRGLPFVYECYSAYKDLLFHQGAKSIKGAVYHEPNFILRPYEGAKVTTVHDLSHLRFPHCHPRERVTYLNKHLPRTLDEANHIITVSHFMKDEIVKYLNVSPDRVSAIPHGIDPSFRPRDSKELRPILSSYQLEPQKYFLCVATLEPRKNLERLLEAYAQLDQKIRQRYPLVLAGASGWKNQNLMQKIDNLSLKGEVRYLGYVSDPQLQALYAGAYLVAFVPLYEGFGLPALEALASGVPLVTSNYSSLPEVVGEAALKVDPENVQAITESLERLVEDQELHDRLVGAGPRQAKKFTWKKCTDETLKVYDKALVA